jgi:hypothetical protein
VYGNDVDIYGSTVVSGNGSPPTGADGPASGFGDRLFEELRVLVVAGVPFGVLVAGVGSRLAMFVLRLTSSDRVIGIRSDDDFVIGRFTLGGTYNLLLLGAAFGFVGAGVYRLVAPRLIGPMWFRRVTTAVASGAVVGSMLVSADGIDYRLLKPTWFAIALFVTLPALFGWLIGPVVDRVAHPDSWTRLGKRRWALPIVVLVPFPLALLPLTMVFVVMTVLMAIGEIARLDRLRVWKPYGIVVRGIWLGVAVLGLFVLIEDIVEIGRVV